MTEKGVCILTTHKICFMNTMTVKNGKVYLQIFIVLFAFGVFAGTATGIRISDTAEVVVSNSMNSEYGYISGSHITVKTLTESLAGTFVFDLFVLLCAFSAVGVLALPFAAILKGFTLSYFSSSLMTTFGAGCMPYILLICPTEALICVPCLQNAFSFAADSSLRIARGFFGGNERCSPDNRFIKNCAVRAAALMTAFLYTYFILPRLAELTTFAA